jgi:peroxiredoxin
MKRWFSGGLVVAAVGLILMALGPLFKPNVVQLDAPAPEFKLSALKGGLVSLSDHRGKVVLLNFWATWCPGCVDELPALEKVYRSLSKDGFTILAVSLDEKRSAVSPYIAKLGLTFPVLMGDSRVPGVYRVGGLPISYLLDQNGVVVKRYAGVIDPSSLENDILGLLQRRTP